MRKYRKAEDCMAEKPLLNTYLFNGNDELKQEMLLERLTKRIAQVGDLSMNLQVLIAKDIKDPTQMLDALNTMPFGSPLRLVVIKEVNRAAKGVQESLIGYIKQPSPTTVLVLTAEKLEERTALFKAIKAQDPSSILDCSQKKRSELPQLVQNIARQEGVDISFVAARALVERVDGETVMLNNETRKLAAIVRTRGDREIGERDVAQHVARLAEPKLWELTDALALRDTALCLILIERMRSYTAIGLLTPCIIRIREILTAMILKQRGQSVAQYMHKKDWQVKGLLRATELFKQEELEALLKQAPQTEALMKSGADADQLLKLWVINACAQNSA